MQTKISILFIAVYIGFMTSCSISDNPSNSIVLTQIGQGNLFGNGQENISKQNLVILDDNTWRNLQSKMNAVNNVSDEFTETNIDFTKFTVIASFDEVKTSGGYSIDITKITEGESNIFVTVKNISNDGNATTVMTQPYDIAKIPKTYKSIIFE
jgi:PrcB C-terminal